MWFLNNMISFYKLPVMLVFRRKGNDILFYVALKKLIRGILTLWKCNYDMFFYFPSWIGVKPAGWHACIGKSNSLSFVPAQKLAHSCNVHQNFPSLLVLHKGRSYSGCFKSAVRFQPLKTLKLHLEALKQVLFKSYSELVWFGCSG